MTNALLLYMHGGFNTYDTLYCILSGVASQTIQFRYVNSAMFINYKAINTINF
jgi:hypothetical protein